MLKQKEVCWAEFPLGRGWNAEWEKGELEVVCDTPGQMGGFALFTRTKL